MFCKRGECRKVDKKGKEVYRCGLLIDMTMQTSSPEGSRTNVITDCLLVAMLTSLHRNEQALVRIQSAIEHSRNQRNIDSQEIIKTVAQGMAGILYSAKEDPKAAIMISKLLSTISEKNIIQQQAIEANAQIADGKLPGVDGSDDEKGPIQ